MAFTLPELGYAYQALEPHIDARTMEIHHSKHHQAYVTNLNNAIAGSQLENLSLEEILKNLDMNNMPVRNNGGGHWNHSLFWDVINPESRGVLSGPLADAISSAFGSKEAFMEKFNAAAMSRFGSGWAWLCAHKDGSVEICSSPNQDNPLMPGVGCGGRPVLGLDVWEHAYYLHYQNRRDEYIKNFWRVVDWDFVADRL